MYPDYYANEYRRYAVYCRNYGDNKLFKVACGPNNDDYRWTETLMRMAGRDMDALSLHNYVWRWSDYATGFDATGYFDVVRDALDMENLVTKHSTIMDKYDPDKRVALFVDEWGTWYKVDEGTNPGFLYQQNTMRDAVVAASLLNVFNNHSDRVRMTNIAQTVNVLQAVLLTEGDKMIKTPTYHIYDLYTPHHDATLIGCDVLENEKYTVDVLPEKNDRRMPDVLDAVNISATKAADGSITATVCNIAHDKAVECELDLAGNSYSEATARILTSAAFDDMNTFENPDKVVIESVNVHLANGKVKFTLPAFSTIAVTVK